jgi:hypothetical protein
MEVFSELKRKIFKKIAVKNRFECLEIVLENLFLIQMLRELLKSS